MHRMNQILVVLFFTSIVTLQMSSSQCPVDKLPAGWKRINVRDSDFCYAVGSSQTASSSGRSRCRSLFKGYLARFHDGKSMSDVARNIKINTKSIWFDAVSGPNDEWMWSDGRSIAQTVMRKMQSSGKPSANDCGALIDDSSPKFSKWDSEECTAHHYFLCQTPKLKSGADGCGDNGLRIYNKCYILSKSRYNFQTSVTKCRDVNGRIAPLSNVEIGTAIVNFFEMKESNTNGRFWLDMFWDATTKIWVHSTNNETVNKYEQKWSSKSNYKSTNNGMTSGVIDQDIGWNWRTWNPNFLAYYVCEVDDNLSERGLLPEVNTVEGVTSQWINESTVTQTNSNSPVNPIILGIVGGCVIFLLLITVIIACLYRHKKCCFQRKKRKAPTPDPTVPSSSFANVSYGNIIDRTSPSSQNATISIRRELPEPPDENDMVYATITDSNEGLYTAPIATDDVDNISTLPMPRTTPNSRINLHDQEESAQASTLTIPHTTRPVKHTMSPPRERGACVSSPSYAPMQSTDTSKSESALQYAELSFDTRMRLSQLENDTYGRADESPTRTSSTDHQTSTNEDTTHAKDYVNGPLIYETDSANSIIDL